MCIEDNVYWRQCVLSNAHDFGDDVYWRQCVLSNAHDFGDDVYWRQCVLSKAQRFGDVYRDYVYCQMHNVLETCIGDNVYC